MKTIGLLGGMSWESTAHYYQIINEEVQQALGGLHSAKILLHSVDFAEIEKYQSGGQWEKCGEILGRAAQGLESAGADLILICTNTIHKVVPQIASMIQIPLLHIADAAADELEMSHCRRVGLLGTKYTMTQDFYKSRLARRGIQVLLPSAEDMDAIHAIIFTELCIGKISEPSRQKLQEIIENLQARGAEGILLGCTELDMLIHPSDVSLPLFDTTVIHAKKAAHIAMEEQVSSTNFKAI